MNTKIKLLTITLVFLFSYVLVGCGNSSSKQQTAQGIQQEFPLEEIFNKFYAEAVEDYKRTAKDDAKPLGRYGLDTDAVHKMLQDSIVKNKLIYLKSQAYYDMILDRFFYDMNTTVAYIRNNKGYNYSILLYTCYGDVRMDMPSLKLTYYPEMDILDIVFKIDGRIVQSDGEIHYNTEGWRINTHDVKNEFGEVIETECVASYTIDGVEYSYSKYKFALVLRWNYLTLWTNEFGDLSDVESIQIKDHDSGKIYNIRYDERHHHQNGGAMNDDIGVFIGKENMGDFIRLVSGLTNFSILIKSNYDDSVLISKPENFNNIADVYQQIIVNTQKLIENENK